MSFGTLLGFLITFSPNTASASSLRSPSCSLFSTPSPSPSSYPLHPFSLTPPINSNPPIPLSIFFLHFLTPFSPPIGTPPSTLGSHISSSLPLSSSCLALPPLSLVGFHSCGE
ncbi:hypothetical protein AMECASPLE_009675 [Ameca splendens]|uniref:Uncharacterized protein n=1 Tax=Ameca splendens TaxID=208324 RepID=A0ABV0ZL88_9TELE